MCLLRGTDWVFKDIYVFCVELRTNSDYFLIEHQLIFAHNSALKRACHVWAVSLGPLIADAGDRFQGSPFDISDGPRGAVSFHRC